MAAVAAEGEDRFLAWLGMTTKGCRFSMKPMRPGRIRLRWFILAQVRLGLRYTKEEFLSR